MTTNGGSTCLKRTCWSECVYALNRFRTICSCYNGCKRTDYWKYKLPVQGTLTYSYGSIMNYYCHKLCIYSERECLPKFGRGQCTLPPYKGIFYQSTSFMVYRTNLINEKWQQIISNQVIICSRIWAKEYTTSRYILSGNDCTSAVSVWQFGTLW